MDIRYSIEAIGPESAHWPRRQLAAGRYVIGRGADCDLPMAVEGVSRRHVELEVLDDGGVIVTDLGSTNGTRIDDRSVARVAANGDFTLQVAACRLQLRAHDPRLSGLAYATGASSDGVPSPADQRAADRTRVLSLAGQLRRAVHSAAPFGTGLAEALGRCLAAMLEPLDARALCLVDDRDRLLAAAGDMALERRTVARGEHLRVEIDRDCALAEVAGPALLPILDWLPVPVAEGLEAAPPEPTEFPGVPSVEPAVRRSLTALQRVAGTRIGILLFGETGVGKDLVARWIHHCSPRASGPFVAINCAALPEDLLEAELFGIEEGTATGVRARPGLFEQAHGGTLFLDELGDMSPRMQVRLLRVLEDGRVHRVGGTTLTRVDVRLVGATHRDLGRAIEDGEFRQDLYHRLAGFEVSLPPLRERRADLPALAIRFYRDALEESGLSSPGITVGAMQALQAWPWPGNVRELRQVMAASVAGLVAGEALDVAHLPERLRRAVAELPKPAGNGAVGGSLAERLAEAERVALLEALAASGGEVEAARQQLGIGKSSFYDKMKKHGLGRAGA